MKVWAKGSGYHFKNSEQCYGEAFVPENSPVDVASIKISGPYPERGFLYNQESYEIVFIVNGSGSVETPEGKTELNSGDVVHFAPEERIAWDGDMTILAVCSPQFDETKHKIEEKL